LELPIGATTLALHYTRGRGSNSFKEDDRIFETYGFTPIEVRWSGSSTRPDVNPEKNAGRLMIYW